MLFPRRGEPVLLESSASSSLSFSLGCTFSSFFLLDGGGGGPFLGGGALCGGFFDFSSFFRLSTSFVESKGAVLDSFSIFSSCLFLFLPPSTSSSLVPESAATLFSSVFLASFPVEFSSFWATGGTLRGGGGCGLVEGGGGGLLILGPTKK